VEEMRQEHCDVLETLKKANLAKTAQRVAVLENIIRAERPLTANEILENVSDEITINRVTVYRILSTFLNSNIVREIGLDHGATHYEMACIHNPVHPHFRCRRCGKIICLPPLTLSQAWDWLTQPSDFSVERIDVQLVGLCANCRKNEKSNSVAFDQSTK
jgi:Fur family transcriptional regulator, ferric uptake regulator